MPKRNQPEQPEDWRDPQGGRGSASPGEGIPFMPPQPAPPEINEEGVIVRREILTARIAALSARRPIATHTLRFTQELSDEDLRSVRVAMGLLRLRCDAAVAQLDANERARLNYLVGWTSALELEVKWSLALPGEVVFPCGEKELTALITRAIRESERHLKAKDKTPSVHAFPLVLTWIENDEHRLDVEPASQPELQRVSFDELVVPALSEVAPGLAELSASIQLQRESLADKLQDELKKLENHSFESAGEAVAFARGLSRILAGLELRIACPGDDRPDTLRCGRPASIECAPTSAKPYWVLRFRHAPMQRGENPHGYYHRVPALEVVPMPPDRRRKP